MPKNYKPKRGTNQTSGLGAKHWDKIFWPEPQLTKGDLLAYYQKISPSLFPYLANRPLNLHRYPGGINGENFYQKNIPHPPKKVQTTAIKVKSKNKTDRYLVCGNQTSLQYAISLGVIEFNPWTAKLPSLHNPSYLVIDLDPENISFQAIITTALIAHEILEKAGIKNFCKTSGKSGLHIYIPLDGKYTFRQIKPLAQLIAQKVNQKLPKLTSLERRPEKRRRKVYLDILQNNYNQSVVAPYSVRPTPDATVSTPLAWHEVKNGLDPKKFTIKTIFSRLKKYGDLFRPVLGSGIDLKRALKNLQK